MVSSVAVLQAGIRHDIAACLNQFSELLGRVSRLERDTRQMQQTINELSAALTDSRGDEASAGSQTWQWRWGGTLHEAPSA